MALLQFTDNILKNMDMKKISLIVLLDISKAFDSIQSERLLMKLQKIGISTTAWTWFESYLTKCSQLLKIEDNIQSDPFLLNFWVPQGSILGPYRSQCILAIYCWFLSTANLQVTWTTQKFSYLFLLVILLTQAMR